MAVLLTPDGVTTVVAPKVPTRNRHTACFPLWEVEDLIDACGGGVTFFTAKPGNKLLAIPTNAGERGKPYNAQASAMFGNGTTKLYGPVLLGEFEEFRGDTAATYM